MAQSNARPRLAQISVQEFADRLSSTPSGLQLIDVREPHEVEIAAIPEFTILPLSEFSQWSGEIYKHLDPEKETLVLCHHGIRSAQMCQWLQTQGFTQVKNISGGIDAYSQLVDPTVPRY
ncbi:rhodanese-related sulfurtransferase [Phormidium pseudopriestleyi FRX01]|uniref:Rhodanese-related sulfurtransferase n=1 Tax=Phormidium pseudopriestleyi FRX01 TaxID=1759528 RepID=A0ABS3FNT2_9CYAN|nr:rhodanese-like domain-containing protein [Phormidium pseudopriestleyi]MBO0348766.1 rhodanese-related sulfurtransferase [Phormidium pseudopriestleyi FRX01]